MKLFLLMIEWYTDSGGLAQLGERLTGSQEVTGSSPVSSTNVQLKSRKWLFNYHGSIQRYGREYDKIINMKTKMIVGLGNPGREYQKTRHNAGFLAIDKLAEKLNITLDLKKFKAQYQITTINQTKVILVKPQTYMNNSGEAVVALMRYYQVEVEDLLVLSDDVDLPVGKIRIRSKGSDGGQKGIRSIHQFLKTRDFARCRIGIGNDPLIPMADYVLGKIPKQEWDRFEPSLDEAANAAYDFIHQSIEQVMNKHNPVKNSIVIHEA